VCVRRICNVYVNVCVWHFVWDLYVWVLKWIYVKAYLEKNWTDFDDIQNLRVTRKSKLISTNEFASAPGWVPVDTKYCSNNTVDVQE
jgi:hypothetical protein